MAGRAIVHALAWFGFMGLLLFVPAGTLDWPSAWAFLVELLGLSTVTGLLLVRHDPALVAERLGPPVQKGQPTADKFLLIAILLSLAGWLVFMGFDARFGWSTVPVWVQVVGALSLGLSLWIGYRAMRENSFAAPVVRIQKERGQRVVDTGPYSHVRHPLYAGALFSFIGVPLLLGSWWGLAPTPVFVLLLAARIQLEEKTLRDGLEGYDAYVARVRYRLVPLIW
jgi:protein-S-isoprenylcysteine O-methyltransferase Ste14